MNLYLVALIGLLVVFIVGMIMYGAVFKASLAENNVKLTVPRFIVAGIGMYIIGYAFAWLFQHVDMGSATGITKGIYLGLLLGIPFFAVPFFADSPYYKSANESKVMTAVMVNWVVALVVLGVVIGFILK